MTTETSLTSAKDLARAYWSACDAADGAALEALCAPAMRWEGPWPVKAAGSASEVRDLWAAPLARALPGFARRYHILTAGRSDAREKGGGDGRLWVAGTGYLEGVAAAEVFGIPATPHPLRLRWGEFLCIEDGRIAEAQMLVDFVDWFEQIGRPVLQPNATPGVWPAATGFDATALDGADAAETAASRALGRELIYGGLNVYDETDLASMGMRRFFHPNLKWYGPGGIGACLDFGEFETRHQAVWLAAFPDRKVHELRSLFAEGRVVSALGPMGVLATHAGPYLGTPPSGARLEISGLDFWLRSGARFTENWVFVDMIKLFAQMGVDLFARMRTGGEVAA
jgi:predicted ester cyclase